MTAPTDAPVEERHIAAAERALRPTNANGVFSVRAQARALAVAQSLANAERDGRASRDAEVAKLREALCNIANNGDERMTWARSRGFDLATIRGLVADLEEERISFTYLVEQLRLLAYAARDAEVAELQAYKRAWERLEDVATSAPPLMATTSYAIAVSMRSILAEELARKETP